MIKKVEGIVLNTRDYREHDMIVRVLTKEEGKQTFVVRGVKKVKSKQLASAQIFTHAHFHFSYHEGQTMHTLTNADIIQTHPILRNDLLKQTLATFFCEVCETIEEEQVGEMFHLLVEAFTFLETSEQPYAVASLFMSCILKMQGMQPYVDGCVRCHCKQGICSISWKEGGFLCQDCYHVSMGKCYDKEELTLFRLMSKAQMEHFLTLESYAHWSYEHFLLHYHFFEYYSGVTIKSMKFLQCLQSMNSS